MLESTFASFVKLSFFFVSTSYWMSFFTWFFSADSFATNVFEMTISATVLKAAITSVVMITLKQAGDELCQAQHSLSLDLDTN